jgi:Polyketide cyclase / dehydrase and lipid transport
MAELNILAEATPDRVWAVLADGYRYDDWVVGTKDVVGVDATWPAVGSRLRFRFGFGPLTFDGDTVVRICEPRERLELEAHAMPIGTARIAIRLVPWADETLVFIDEHPLRGPGARVHNAVSEVVLRLRLGQMLRNLARLATDPQTHSAASTP